LIFKDRVKACRLLLGLTQRQLGLVLQVTNQSVYNWEAGIEQPPFTAQIGVATILDRLLAKKALIGELSANLTTEINDIADLVNDPPFPCENTASTLDGDELSATKSKLSTGENGTNGERTFSLDGSRAPEETEASSPGLDFEFG
jgi:transcriptional regulator with XRE-family HTH domain